MLVYRRVYLIYSNPIQSIYMQRTNTWSTPMHCKPGTKKKKLAIRPSLLPKDHLPPMRSISLKVTAPVRKKTWDIYGLIEMNNKGI